jgi:hypothetical protein
VRRTRLQRPKTLFWVFHTAVIARKNDFLLSVNGAAEIYEQLASFNLHTNKAAGRGGRDRNWRCGHSRSLRILCANQGVDANQHHAQTKLLREVLTDNSYRGYHASVQKVARNLGKH